MANYFVDFTVHYDKILKRFITGQMNFFAKDPYCRPIGFGHELFDPMKWSYFPPGFIVVLQILVYCHLSPGSHNSVVKYLEKLGYGQGTSSVCQYSRLHSSRSCLKALILSVHASSRQSHDHWTGALKSPVCQNKRVPRKELFHPDKIRQNSLDSHFVYIGRETISVFLVMSAIRHSCNFLGIWVSIKGL